MYRNYIDKLYILAALGKRTRYQEESLAQLVVSVEAVNKEKLKKIETEEAFDVIDPTLLPSVSNF